MTVRDFSRTFFNIAVQPKSKRDKWTLKVIDRSTQKTLMCDYIVCEIHTPTRVFDRVIHKWWIEYDTVVVLVE